MNLSLFANYFSIISSIIKDVGKFYTVGLLQCDRTPKILITKTSCNLARFVLVTISERDWSGQPIQAGFGGESIQIGESSEGQAMNRSIRALFGAAVLSALCAATPASAVPITDIVNPTDTTITFGATPSPCPALFTCTYQRIVFRA